MLKLPRHQPAEMEIGTGEYESVAVQPQGRQSFRPQAMGSVPPPSVSNPYSQPGSVPPPAFRSSPPPSLQQMQQMQEQAAYAQQMQMQGYAPQSGFQPVYAQSQMMPASYGYGAPHAPPPPVPWAPPPPSSLAAITDPTSQHMALQASISTSTPKRSGGMVWAATLVLMGAALGSMYGVFMRGGEAPVAAAAVQAPQAPQATSAPVVAQPVAVQPVAQPMSAPAQQAQPVQAASLVGVLGPASPVVIPTKPVEEPVASKPGKPEKKTAKGGHAAPARATLAAAVPAPPKPAPEASKAPVSKPVVSKPAPKAGKTSADELSAAQLLKKSTDATNDSL